jgi:hypothetical protein
MVLVPEGLLHPDWSPATVELAELNHVTLSLDKHAATELLRPYSPLSHALPASPSQSRWFLTVSPKKKFVESRLSRLHLFDFPTFAPRAPHDPACASSALRLPANAPHQSTFSSPPLRRHSPSAPAGAVTVPPRILDMIETQLEERVGQEVELLLERVICSRGDCGPVLREVSADERAAMRDGDWWSDDWDRLADSRTVAFIETGPSLDAAAFLRTPSDPAVSDAASQDSNGKKRRKGSAPAPISSTRTCSLITSHPASEEHPAIPFHPLSLLLGPSHQAHLSARLAMLAASPLNSPPQPLGDSTRTYALISSPRHLSSHGVDTFPLFRALWRLRIWKDEPGWALATRSSTGSGRGRDARASAPGGVV